MAMWRVRVHRLVVREDLKRITGRDRRLILKTVYKKLALDPEKYGQRLHGELREYWKLKVSDYRVIYRIRKQEVLVLVLKIGLRRDDEVYRQMLLRMKRV